MLAGGCIAATSQRHHLADPGSHGSEVVAAGNNLNTLTPINGLLQELRIRLGKTTPFYLDSQTTVFVATKDQAVKNSVWLLRRVAVLTDAVKNGEILPIHIKDPDMVADAWTKYLVHQVWVKHIRYAMNVSEGDDT